MVRTAGELFRVEAAGLAWQLKVDWTTGRLLVQRRDPGEQEFSTRAILS